MKRRVEITSVSGTPGKGDLLSLTPRVCEVLFDDKYEDGKPRKRGSLLIFADGPVMKALLLDKDVGEQLWSVGETLEAAIMAMEESLETGSAAWTRSAVSPQKRTR